MRTRPLIIAAAVTALGTLFAASWTLRMPARTDTPNEVTVAFSADVLPTETLPAQVSTPRPPAPPPRDVWYESFFAGWPEDTSPLDGTERFVEPRSRVRCATDELVVHRGERFRYVARVHASFVPRLRRFEDLVTDLAVEYYGRPPRRMSHRGSFVCRLARGRRGRISEHAFGNAIDVTGFDFGPLPRESELSLAPGLRRPLRVRVLRHWRPRRTRDAVHARFLHALTEELRRRPDVMRGIVGPPRPRHSDHLHLDASPWRYSMFGYDRVAGEPPTR